MAKGPQGAIPVAPSLCSFAGPSWRFRLGPQEMNLSAATLLSQSVETLPPPIPTCHSHDCKLADPRKLPGPSTSQRWDCLPSNQARIRGIEHPQLLSLQPSLRPTAHEYRSFLCLLKTADPGLGNQRQGNADPVRVEKAFPAIITKAQFRRVGGHLSSRAPKFSHPRRVGSSYLLSGLVKCEACKMPLTGRFAKSGKYSYYVCQSNINFGKDACDTPTLNARRFEELVVDKIRSDILTEGIIRELVKVVDEKMGGVAREQRKRLKTIEDELQDVKRQLDRIWRYIATSDTVMADASVHIQQLRDRQERLEDAAEDAREILAQRRKAQDDVNTIAAYAEEMRDFLDESELTECRTFIQSFVKEIVVMPGDILLRYTVPMPDDSRIPGRNAEDMVLDGSVLTTKR